ncbi:hypothetical protein LMH73_023945 [Vibrio splendidus]|nr:hypothetical protein [Vibrio splendidus]MCC4883196.1 hypothetical protein [Vibrio splendidus]
MGVSVVFAGQDYQSLKKASEEEAAATVANTNIKICMKLEDPKETLQIMQERAGEAYMARLPGHENKDDASIGALYKQMKTTQIELVKRMSLRDLVSQPPGHAHVINGDKMERCTLYFADPDEVDEAKLNKFMMVDKPSRTVIDKYNNACQRLKLLWESDEPRDYSDLESDPGISQIVFDVNMCLTHKMSIADSSQLAVGIFELRERMREDILNAQSLTDNALPVEKSTAKAAPAARVAPVAKVAVESISDVATAVKTAPVVVATEKVAPQEKAVVVAEQAASINPHEAIDPLAILNEALGKLDLGNEQPESNENARQKEIEDEQENGYLDAVDESNRPAPDMEMSERVKDFEMSFEDLLTKAVESSVEVRANKELSDEDKLKVSPASTLTELERIGGMSRVASEGEAQKTMDFISKKIAFDEYANEPIPEKQSQDALKLILASLGSAIKV